MEGGKGKQEGGYFRQSALDPEGSRLSRVYYPISSAKKIGIFPSRPTLLCSEEAWACLLTIDCLFPFNSLFSIWVFNLLGVELPHVAGFHRLLENTLNSVPFPSSPQDVIWLSGLIRTFSISPEVGTLSTLRSSGPLLISVRRGASLLSVNMRDETGPIWHPGAMCCQGQLHNLQDSGKNKNTWSPCPKSRGKVLVQVLKF